VAVRTGSQGLVTLFTVDPADRRFVDRKVMSSSDALECSGWKFESVPGTTCISEGVEHDLLEIADGQ
jgi:hypothetical protein